MAESQDRTIFAQIGQCGNQLGFNFFNLHYEAFLNPADYRIRQYVKHFADFNEHSVKTRSIILDSEPTVIENAVVGQYQDYFSKEQIFVDPSYNNIYDLVDNGTHGEKILDFFYRKNDLCSGFNSVYLVFSIGGATGSGLGPAILELLETHFPKIDRVVFSVFPSTVDDIVTAPYNAVLATSKLIEHADLVLNFENDLLQAQCLRSQRKLTLRRGPNYISQLPTPFCKSFLPDIQENQRFNPMNYLILRSMLDFTCPDRFAEIYRIVLRNLITGIVPHKRLHFCVPAIAPLFPHEIQSHDYLFNDLFAGTNNLSSYSMRKDLISAYLLSRKATSPIQMQNNILEANFRLRSDDPNAIEWMIGCSDVPPIGLTHSLFLLANSTNIAKSFLKLEDRFVKLFNVKKNLHHFTGTNGDSQEMLNNALGNLTDLIAEYRYY